MTAIKNNSDVGAYLKAKSSQLIEITPHPRWLQRFVNDLALTQTRITEHQVFRDLATAKLPVKTIQEAQINFYPLIETFPTYMGLILAKVPAGASIWNNRVRHWLLTNMNVERRHANWWKNFAKGFGVADHRFSKATSPPAQMDAINNYLWRVCSFGSLAEGLSALNYAIEGPTGQWAKSVLPGIKKYRTIPGVEINERTLEWLKAHASYDDKHPYEALELIKALTKTPEQREKTFHAAKRSLEYYALALDYCYQEFV